MPIANTVSYVDFLRSGWLGVGLGPYRRCDRTYSFYETDELPALPTHLFDGTFGWLPPGKVRASAGTDRLPTALRREVPDAVATFFDRPGLQAAVPSRTGCYRDVSRSAIPGPFGNGDRLLRFLADSQDCILWYLHILPNGRHHVVAAGQRYGDDLLLPSTAHLNVELAVVADDFESFLYRFWVENTAWFEVVHDERDESALSPGGVRLPGPLP